MQEQAQIEIIHPQKVKEGLAFRIVGWQAKQYLQGFSLATQVKKFFVDWQAFRDGLNNWDYWKPPAVSILIDNGLGCIGACPHHGCPHISIFPVGTTPPICAEALKVQG